jgi:hypothetical protein
MSATTRIVPVVMPRSGETLRLWAMEARVAWYRVHPVGLEHAAPCTPRDCCYCRTEHAHLRPRWDGYLLACLAGRPRQVCVVRLPGHLYDRSTDLHRVPDCRDGEWTYWRRPGPGAAALTVRHEGWQLGWPQELPEARSHWPHCLDWWVLPEGDPDYRLGVYVDLVPRVAPAEDAEVLALSRGDGP